jgi:peptidoglycan-associated lipoprotein
MNTFLKGAIVVGSLGMMISAGGCANKEVVKKDEPMAGNTVSAKPVAAPAKDTKASPSMNMAKPAPVVQATQAATSQQTAKTAVNQSAFEKIYFNFDSSDLSKSSRDTLTRSADVLMKEQKNVKLRIEGNCDERGAAEYNLALGERRAKAAAKYLTTLGVQPERLSVVSYGKEKPAVQGSDEAAWAKNRRDEFVIVK